MLNRLMIIVVLAGLTSLASECDTPLVDRQIEFYATNQGDETILLYTGEGQIQNFPQELPSNRVVPYAPIAPGETGYIAIPTGSNNVFDELPDRLLRIWVFQDSIFNFIPYDSIRQNTDLFELIELTEDEYEMMGDTLFVD